MNSPHITVLTPLYNGVEFLQDCVTSVIAQTYTSWEMIIAVNGHGETGGHVAEQARKIAKSDSRIQVIVQGPHIHGKVQSLNDAMKVAKAEWICLLDCDDMWEPTKLQLQVEAQQTFARDAAVIGTNCIYIGDMFGSPNIPDGWIDFQTLLNCNSVINSSAMIHRSHAHWDSGFGMEDYDMWLRITVVGGKIYNIPNILVYHRIHSSSAFNSQGHDPNKLREKYAALKDLLV